MTMMQGLPLTGVSVSANAKKRGEVWLSTCMIQVKSMHKLISSLYDGLEGEDVYDDDCNDDVQIPKGDSTKHAQVFADHCYKLVNLMREPTNGPVELPVSNIITVLTRCLKISYTDVLSVPSRTDLASLAPRLYQSCMDVLSQLILCCGGDILHQSRVIIDLCLQTLTSTAKMSHEDKCCTKSSTYQALVLWIKTCGWGKYLSSHSKVLIQELITDTLADTEDRSGKKTPREESKGKHDMIGHKRKGKRKRGRKGDSYMELEKEEDGDKVKQSSEERLDLALWAFSLSQLAVEYLPFSTAQNLIAHLIKTAVTVQRLSLNRPSPYRQGEARKGLYQAVAACLLSPLSYGCNRNDAVGHYQLTNQALDLLAKACHKEETQIEAVCSQALDILRASSNLKGPVIRKTLDFEDTAVEDITQLMREKEQMTDDIEGLRQKLMNSEMENEQQSRLISSLREQLAGLQAKVPTVCQESSSTRNSLPQISDDEDDVQSEKDDESDKADEQITVALSDATNIGHMLPEYTGKLSGPSSMDFPQDKSVNSTRTDDKMSREGPQRKESDLKRTKTTEKSPEDAKRSKKDPSSKSSGEQDNSVEDMLQDFVDAPPDS